MFERARGISLLRAARGFLWALGAAGLLAASAGAVIEEANAHPPAAVRAFNEGVKHFNAGDFKAAIPSFDEAISDDDNFAEAYYARAACRHSLGGEDGALMDLSDALRIRSDYLEAHSLRGVIYYEGNRYDPALDDFNYVLQRRPGDAQSLIGRGVIYLKREQSAAAERDFRKFLKLHPEDPLAPKLRKLVAELSRSAPEAEPEAAASEAGSGAPPGARRPSPEARRLADSLLSQHHDLSEAFGRKVLRGERAEVVGDITAEPDARSGGAPDNDAPQVVEPQ